MVLLTIINSKRMCKWRKSTTIASKSLDTMIRIVTSTKNWSKMTKVWCNLIMMEVVNQKRSFWWLKHIWLKIKPTIGTLTQGASILWLEIKTGSSSLMIHWGGPFDLQIITWSHEKEWRTFLWRRRVEKKLSYVMCYMCLIWQETWLARANCLTNATQWV